MVQPPGDLVGLVAQEKKAHGLNTVCLAGSNILLLSAAGHFQLAASQILDITDDGTNPTVEKPESQVFVAEQPSLVACLSGQTEDAGTSQALDPVR